MLSKKVVYLKVQENLMKIYHEGYCKQIFRNIFGRLLLGSSIVRQSEALLEPCWTSLIKHICKKN